MQMVMVGPLGQGCADGDQATLRLWLDAQRQAALDSSCPMIPIAGRTISARAAGGRFRRCPGPPHRGRSRLRFGGRRRRVRRGWERGRARGPGCGVRPGVRGLRPRVRRPVQATRAPLFRRLLARPSLARPGSSPMCLQGPNVWTAIHLPLVVMAGRRRTRLVPPLETSARPAGSGGVGC